MDSDIGYQWRRCACYSRNLTPVTPTSWKRWYWWSWVEVMLVIFNMSSLPSSLSESYTPAYYVIGYAGLICLCCLVDVFAVWRSPCQPKIEMFNATCSLGMSLGLALAGASILLFKYVPYVTLLEIGVYVQTPLFGLSTLVHLIYLRFLNTYYQCSWPWICEST